MDKQHPAAISGKERQGAAKSGKIRHKRFFSTVATSDNRRQGATRSGKIRHKRFLSAVATSGN
jgi:hypothetical protein